MTSLTGLADAVVLAWGWRRRLIALTAGAIGALAMPPFGMWPLLAASLTIAVWQIDGATGSGSRPRLGAVLSAAGAGWWWGFGYFVAGLWWLGGAFLVDADEFAWALPLGVLGLPAVLAIFFALGFALARLAWSDRAGRILSFTAALAAVEWLRGHVLTGFPWNTLGMAFGGGDILAQPAAIIGLYGLTLVAVAILAAPATLVASGGAAARWTAPTLAAIALGGLAAFGAWRLAGPDPGMAAGVRLRIMQPNLQQDQKFRPENRDAIMRRYLTLSDKATSPTSGGVVDVTHLIWPESPFPFVLSRDREALGQLASLLPQGVTLITGAIRAEEPLPGESSARYFNAVHVVGDDGTVLDGYDKVHLVPFGEYLPFKAWLERAGLRQFIHVPGGFEAGHRRKRLTARGLPPIAPLICYEAIFPGETGSPEGRAGVLLNLTNDGWFGDTPGPRQHFAQARLRAIEQGLPLVRAANTGVSAVVDARGAVMAMLDVGREDVLDSGLPRPLPPTIYARFGDLGFLALCALTVAFAIRLNRRRDWANPKPSRG